VFADWALSQIKQPVIEPGFIASTTQITAIIAVYNLQLSSACIFHFFIETYFALMEGDRLAALESYVFSLKNRRKARNAASAPARSLTFQDAAACLLTSVQGHREHHSDKRWPQ